MNPIITGQTALFSPADRPDRARKALSSNADIVIIDLEDAVAPDAKKQARETLAEILAGAPERSGIAIRVNDPATDLGQADLATLTQLASASDLPAFSIMVPKFTLNTPVSTLPEDILIIGLIETAQGVRDLHMIATDPRIARLALGAIDLSTELGCEPQSATIDAVRAQLVVASSAAGLPAPLDSPCVDFRDAELVNQAAYRARRDGFGGLLCIHPAQLDPIKQAFLPSAEDIAWAREVVAVGEAATSINGQMVDRPVVLRAQRILDTAESSLSS